MRVFSLAARLLVLAAAGSGIASLGFAFAAAWKPERKAANTRVALLLFAATMFLASASQFLSQARLTQAEGSVESATINPCPEITRTEILLSVSARVDLPLIATGVSPFFRPNERVIVHYRAASGNILRAEFLAPNGLPDGNYRSPEMDQPWFCLFAGFALALAGWRIARREPSCPK